MGWQKDIEYTGQKLVRYSSEEWSALYIDGELDTVGDHYHSEARLAQLLKVEEHQENDSFMLGGKSYSDVAKNLSQIEAFESTRNRLEEEAIQLEIQAANLQAQADALKAKAKELKEADKD